MALRKFYVHEAFAPILEKEAEPLIEFFRRRRDDPSYFVRVGRCIKSLDDAALHLNSAAQALLFMLKPSSYGAKPSRQRQPLDGEHAANINSMLAVYDDLDIDGLREALLRHAHICADAAAWFATFTGARPSSKKHGRPALKGYIDETRAFMQVWKKVTGKSAVFPKTHGKKAKHASQPSTDFILRCLQKIDPKITVSNAITAIRDLMDTEPAPNKHDKSLAKIRAQKKVKEAELLSDFLPEKI